MLLSWQPLLFNDPRFLNDSEIIMTIFQIFHRKSSVSLHLESRHIQTVNNSAEVRLCSRKEDTNTMTKTPQTRAFVASLLPTGARPGSDLTRHSSSLMICYCPIWATASPSLSRPKDSEILPLPYTMSKESHFDNSDKNQDAAP